MFICKLRECLLVRTVASFRKGGSSEPNELPLNPPLSPLGEKLFNRSLEALDSLVCKSAHTIC